jgi:hypothetical protein
MTMGKQAVIVQLDEFVSRKVREFLARPRHGYSSLDEFLSVAALNQLALEEGRSPLRGIHDPPAKPDVPSDGPEHGPHLREASVADHNVARLLSPGVKVPDAALVQAEPAEHETLFVLTNRLSPMKIALRVLANLLGDDEAPGVKEFQGEAAAAARAVGIRLFLEDEREGRTGRERRAIGYPTGRNEKAALERFVASFTLSDGNGAGSGPLALLGLAAVRDGRAYLTEAGRDLALAPSPLLDGAAGPTLSMQEVEIFRGQIRRTSAELEAIREFLRLVTRAGGSQSRLDELFGARNPNWTASQTVAHRSALIGRLLEIGLLEISGRGASATVSLLPAADSFLTSGE